MFPIPQGRYFLHQLAVAPSVRQTGIGKDLVISLVRRLTLQQEPFELEFTIEQHNRATLVLATAVARDVQMHVVKRPDVIDLLEDGYNEELYVLTSKPT